MYRFRNRIAACLLTLVAVINSMILIISPERYYGIGLAASCLEPPSEDYDNDLKASYENDLISQAQELPELQIRLSLKSTVQPVTGSNQFFQPFAPVFTTNINKPGSRYLAPRNFPELNDIELFILHHRLNT
jgi:hypothetical protein